jgi:uncharacterized protein (TIGR02996 family)
VEPFFRKLPGSLPFLQQIAEAPDDPTPRLALADWLSDHGQPDRAEFIRVQCRLLAPEFQSNVEEVEGRFPQNWCERKRLEARAEALFSSNMEEWLGEFRVEGWCPPYSLGHFAGGLLEVVTLGGKMKRQQLQTLLGQADWRRLAVVVVLEGWARARQLLRSRDCPRFRSLRLGFFGTQDGPEWVCELASLPRLADLTALNLYQTSLHDAGVIALLESPHLAGLTYLSLRATGHATQVGSGAARARVLAGSPHLARLNALNLGCNRIDTEGTVALANSPHLAQLTFLDLHGALMRDAGAEALAKSPHLTRLT